MTYTQAPTRGKDRPLKALEEALEVAKIDAMNAEADRRRCKAELIASNKRVAIVRRDLDDIEKAMAAVRNLQTVTLGLYERVAAEEIKELREEDGS